jgi:hypothetical protein
MEAHSWAFLFVGGNMSEMYVASEDDLVEMLETMVLMLKSGRFLPVAGSVTARLNPATNNIEISSDLELAHGGGGTCQKMTNS